MLLSCFRILLRVVLNKLNNSVYIENRYIWITCNLKRYIIIGSNLNSFNAVIDTLPIPESGIGKICFTFDLNAHLTKE